MRLARDAPRHAGASVWRTLLLVGPFPIGSTMRLLKEWRGLIHGRLRHTSSCQAVIHATWFLLSLLSLVTRHPSPVTPSLSPLSRRPAAPKRRQWQRLGKTHQEKHIDHDTEHRDGAERRTGCITSRGLLSVCLYWSANMRSGFNTRHQPSHAHLTLSAWLCKESAAPRQYHCPRGPPPSLCRRTLNYRGCC